MKIQMQLNFTKIVNIFLVIWSSYLANKYQVAMKLFKKLCVLALVNFTANKRFFDTAYSTYLLVNLFLNLFTVQCFFNIDLLIKRGWLLTNSNVDKQTMLMALFILFCPLICIYLSVYRICPSVYLSTCLCRSVYLICQSIVSVSLSIR